MSIQKQVENGVEIPTPVGGIVVSESPHLLVVLLCQNPQQGSMPTAVTNVIYQLPRVVRILRAG